MKILFVSSGNSQDFDIAPFIKSQGESLKRNGIHLEYFLITGNGIKGYLKNILPLRRYLKRNRYDLIHAHYALSAWVAVLTFAKIPIIVSYMGCDTYGDYDENGRLTFLGYILILSAKLLQPFVKSIIVKSKNLEKYIYLKKKVDTIPNGVNLEIFRPLNKFEARKVIGLDLENKYALFLGCKDDKRKNFQLLNKAKKLSAEEFKILTPYPISHNKIPTFLNACDVLVMTSYNEGSPNVIKEAMACNCPIISTDVGDVKEVIGKTEGCYICSYDPGDVADKIKKALDFGRRTDGREKIKHLDEKIIANKLIDLYNKILNDRK